MKYRVAISDFDGTLIGESNRVGERTVRAIREFVNVGGIFGVSTGRAFASIRQRLGELGLKGNFPVMCCQGALSADCESGEIITEIGMPPKAVTEFLRRAQAHGLTTQFYTAQNVYVQEMNEYNKEYFTTNRIEPSIVPDICECAQNMREPMLKVLCYITPEIRGDMFSLFSGIEGIKSFTSNPRLFEAVSVNAGKDNGLKEVCRRLGVDISECVAFGDELNDMEMLKAAGLGVAMGNALDEVKKAADYVTDTCDNDGVAKVLERIVSGEI